MIKDPNTPNSWRDPDEAFRGGNDKLDGGADRDIVSGRDGDAGDDDVAGDIETSSVGFNWSVSRSVIVSGGVTTYSRTYNDTAFLPVLGGGDDVIYGGAGADWLFANEGNDWADGGSGADVVFGEAGSDELFGGEGNDKLFGDSASVPLAQHGDDYILAHGGMDGLSGGASGPTRPAQVNGTKVLEPGLETCRRIAPIGRRTVICTRRSAACGC